MPRIKISMKFINSFLQNRKNRRPKYSEKKKKKKTSQVLYISRYHNFPAITGTNNA